MGNVYLGKRVPDTGRKGFDNLNELRGIIHAILWDLRHGVIDCELAKKRMNFLYFLSKVHLKGRLREAYRMIDAGVAMVERYCMGRRRRKRR